MDQIKLQVKSMTIEELEKLFNDSMQMAFEGIDIDRQRVVSQIVSDEIFERKMAEYK